MKVRMEHSDPVIPSESIWQRFLSNTLLVTKGLNGSQLMPHEIVQKIINNPNISCSEELVLDAQWKDLWKNVVTEVKAKAEVEGVNLDPTHMGK